MLNKEICCWIYTINHSERQRQMAMRVRSGTPAMCMSMDLPERRECDPESSWTNPSLATPTRWVLALMTEMMFEALTDRRP